MEKKAITHFMNRLLKDYSEIRGKSRESYPKPFWDVLVITTADKAQQEAFQLQIDEKLEREELPANLPVHVITDPPGTRIGNGGSTLVALEELEAIYGQDLFTKKILLIHAGGWSQRMPSATILGKVFSLLPHGNPPYQMLDLKLALYWPLVEKIHPGVFLVCADDFVVYSLPETGNWEIPSEGFIALAHPSPIAVGRTHGVYVLPNTDQQDVSKEVAVSRCLKVLQKNNDEMMQAQGAVLKGEDHQFADGIYIQGKAVYTDSSFFFGTDVMKKLISFKKNIGDLSCEIDAYGDFLQAVGENATNEYIHHTVNVSEKTGNLLKMRQAVFDCLNGTDIHVLVLNASSFIHIGTTEELLYHFCEDFHFQKQMSFEKEVFNAWISPISDSSKGKSVSRNEDLVSPTACVMHSILQDGSEISEKCVMEYCDFEVPLQVASKCILSNCQLKASEISMSLSSSLKLPANLFLHTVPVTIGGLDPMYVTMFFNIEDNLKKTVSLEEIEKLPFWISTVGEYMKTQGLTLTQILPKDYLGCSNGFKEDSNEKLTVGGFSLWNLRLYSAGVTMTASLENALQAIGLNLGSSGKNSSFKKVQLSLADLLKCKDVTVMLRYRKQLYEKIRSSC